MSNFGRGGGGSGRKRSFGGDRGGGGGRGGGFGNKRGRYQHDVIPDTVVPLAKVTHTCENQAVCKATTEGVPMFNAAVFLENKTPIGKIDEIFGPLNDYMLSVELLETIKADSLTKKQQLFIDPAKILPKARFIPRDPPDPLAPKPKRKPGQGGGGGGGRGRGGRGGFGGRGGGRGGRGGGGGGRGGGFGNRGGGGGRGGGGFGGGRGGGGGFGFGGRGGRGGRN